MHRPVRRLVALLAVVLAAGGCGTGTQAPGSPDQAVRLVFDELNQGDLDGMLALACQAQQATLREQFGFAGLGATMGLDLSALLEALTIDTSRLTVTTTSIQGDAATVQLAGAMGLSIDASRLRELFRQLAQREGRADRRRPARAGDHRAASNDAVDPDQRECRGDPSRAGRGSCAAG